MTEEKELYEKRRNLGKILLTSELSVNYYEGVRVVYEQTRISNHLLIQQLDQKREFGENPSKTIFYDIVNVVYILSEDDPVFLESIKKHCISNYPSIAKRIHEIEKQTNRKGEDLLLVGFHSLLKLYKDSYRPEVMAYIYLASCSENLLKSEALNTIYRGIMDIVSQHFKAPNHEMLQAMYSKFNTGEEIFISKQYKRWLSERKEKLLEYIRKKNPEILTRISIG